MSTQISSLKNLSDGISVLDKKISQFGLIHPEVKPVTDMFTKRKENFQGDDPVKLAEETRNCYQALIKECESLEEVLIQVTSLIKSTSFPKIYAAVSSINVEVPGR